MKIKLMYLFFAALLFVAFQVRIDAQSTSNNNKRNEASKAQYHTVKKNGKMPVHHQLHKLKNKNILLDIHKTNEKTSNSSTQKINSKMKSEKTHNKEEKKIDQLKKQEKRVNNSSPNKSEKK